MMKQKVRASARPVTYLLAIALAALAIASSASRSTAAASARDVQAFAKSSLIYIATVRKDGLQSKAAPVWFITTTDNQVLLETSPKSWKARRIKRGSPAMIWIGSGVGPAFIGKAEITQNHDLQEQVLQEYPKKYLLARVGFSRPTRAKLDSGQIVVIRVAPTRDLPEGFQSQPGIPAPQLDLKAKNSAN
jgi:hypothetical protein